MKVRTVKKYSNKRKRYVNDLNDFNFILEAAKEFTALSHKDPDKRTGQLKFMSYLNDKERYVELTTRYIKDVEHEDGSITYEYDENYPCTWIFDKTGENVHSITPNIAVRRFESKYSPKKLEESSLHKDDDGRYIESAKPALGYSKKYDNTEHYVYVYDLNSAYANVLKDKFIDTYNQYPAGIVRKGQVGFINNLDLTLVHEGEYADVRFDLIDSPYKDVCEKWYSIKKTSPKGSKEKKEAKDMLVIPIGAWQNRNPYARAYVVNTCNELIDNIRFKHPKEVCMWNTDAIYSTIPLNDLDIGDNIGQFKLEYQGIFRQKGQNYQKVDIDELSYRGINTKCLNRKINLLDDKVDKTSMTLPYWYDKENRTLKESK